MQQAVSGRKISRFFVILYAQQKHLKPALVDTRQTETCPGNLERRRGLLYGEVGKNGVLRVTGNLRGVCMYDIMCSKAMSRVKIQDGKMSACRHGTAEREAII